MFDELFNKETKKKIILNAFDIDYYNPSKYKVNGQVTTLNKDSLELIRTEIGEISHNISDIRKLYDWKDNFNQLRGGGKLIGQTNVNEIIQKKELSGCHDHGLLLTSILREYGIPSVMIDCVDINWAKNRSKDYLGHVFIEVYLNNEWYLANSTTPYYAINYDPQNRLISDKDCKMEYYIIFKGLDTNGYGIKSCKELQCKMEEYAEYIKDNYSKFTSPKYIIKEFI